MTLPQTGAIQEAEINARRLWNDTGIGLAAGQAYRLTASGSWTDWTIACDPEGFPSPNALMRATERLRRAPGQDWFMPMGALDRDLTTASRSGGRRFFGPSGAAD